MLERSAWNQAVRLFVWAKAHWTQHRENWGLTRMPWFCTDRNFLQTSDGMLFIYFAGLSEAGRKPSNGCLEPSLGLRLVVKFSLTMIAMSWNAGRRSVEPSMELFRSARSKFGMRLWKSDCMVPSMIEAGCTHCSPRSTSSRRPAHMCKLVQRGEKARDSMYWGMGFCWFHFKWFFSRKLASWRSNALMSSDFIRNPNLFVSCCFSLVTRRFGSKLSLCTIYRIVFEPDGYPHGRVVTFQPSQSKQSSCPKRKPSIRGLQTSTGLICLIPWSSNSDCLLANWLSTQTLSFCLQTREPQNPKQKKTHLSSAWPMRGARYPLCVLPTRFNIVCSVRIWLTEASLLCYWRMKSMWVLLILPDGFRFLDPLKRSFFLPRFQLLLRL